jgi:hypothetical protein
MVDGSTCGRAGLLLRRMILVFLLGNSLVVSAAGFDRACDAGFGELSEGSDGSGCVAVAGLWTSTSAMASRFVCNSRCAKAKMRLEK